MKTASLFSSSSWPFHFILIIVWLYCCFSTHLVSSQCLDHQKSLLLELKNNLTFDPEASDKLLGWNESTDCCQWIGVECGSSNGRVIGLDLSERHINGGINNLSSLFHLQFLQKLNLGWNYFEGEMPSSFGKLTSLTYLNLSYAGFFGQVPIEISQLVKLVVLDISQVIWERGDARLYMEVPNLAAIIQNMTNMEELYLDGVNNTAIGNKWCDALSTSLPHLQVLSMRDCYLMGEFHKSLLNLRHLSVILLDVNQFLAGPVPEYLTEFTNLTELSLSSSSLNGTVPGKIFQVPTLRSLDLSFTWAQGSLPDFLQDGSLEELNLRDTSFSGMLPSSIRNLKRLRKLDLSNCQFHGRIPSSIESLNLLERLYLTGNRFWGPIPSFSSMQNLEFLDLSGRGNQWYNLSGTISGTEWGKLLKLEYLDLSYNSLDGSIPTSLLSLPLVYSIELSGNKFSGKLSEFASIGSSKLTSLYLSGNNLEGPVPKSVFRLRELQRLGLSSNRFNGTLELAKFLLSFKNLTELDLSFNSLSVNTDGCGGNSSFPQLSSLNLASCNLGDMPDFLKNQSQLDYLDLSMNHMIGTVPSFVWTISQLNLFSNHFVKLEPPLTHSNDSSTYYIDLYSNNIQGKIPAFFSSSIAMLDFSENKFYGTIPRALCNAESLLLLNLGYNLLEGTIPDCLLFMPQLQVLNLRSNKLNGVIPDTIKASSIETIDLNGNFLEGPLPRSLAYIDELKVLDVGYNQLNDTFPCHLESLSKLQVIVLRSNKFHGMTNCLWSYSMWPLLQILDLAVNHFSGELSFFKWIAMVSGTSKRQSKVGYLHSELSNRMGHGRYQNSIALTFKGSSHKLTYILTIFTSIDLSNNNFHGELPRELGNLNALIVLDLSHNSFSGQIPSSIGNLSQMESLDLSCNAFSGKIPAELASLYNLEYFNLSYNKLSGKIPSSTQLDTFTASSYEGNQGLYGPPLSPPTRTKSSPGMSSSENPNWSLTRQLEWMLRGAEVGFPVGLTIFLGPILYIKRYREWYCKHLHRLVKKILRKEDNPRGRRTRRSRQPRPRC